jgi:hypothetical protein
VDFKRAWRAARALAETEYFRFPLSLARANLKDDHYHYAHARYFSFSESRILIIV